MAANRPSVTQWTRRWWTALAGLLVVAAGGHAGGLGRHRHSMRATPTGRRYYVAGVGEIEEYPVAGDHQEISSSACHADEPIRISHVCLLGLMHFQSTRPVVHPVAIPPSDWLTLNRPLARLRSVPPSYPSSSFGNSPLK